MANASFTPFRAGLMTGAINLGTGVIKVAAVRGYTYTATHTFMSDVIAAGGIVNATSAALTNPTTAGGIFDADDTTITTTSSAANHVLIIYQASAATGGADVAQSAQRLCFYMDTGTNLPIQPGAGTLTITWPNTTSKIYQIGS